MSPQSPDPTASPDDRHALIEAAHAGNRDAIERLLVLCQPDIRRFARAQCASAADADDAIQETLWIVYRRIGALRTIAAFPSWLAAIVLRECFRLFRHGGGHEALPQEDDPIFSYRPDDELRRDLVSAIHSLPPKYAEMILLRDFEEHSVEDIADRLKLTREAVKSRIHRARQMIRDYLGS